MVCSPPMRTRGFIVAVAVVVLGLAVQVSGRPEQVPEVATEGEGEDQVTHPDEFGLAQTEAAQTELITPDEIIEAKPDGTEVSETKTDPTNLTGASEDEPNRTEVSEISPSGIDVSETIPSETDAAETSLSEDEMSDLDPSETETPEANLSETKVPETVPSEKDVSENTPSETGNTETGPDQTNLTETKPDMTGTNPGETEANPSEPAMTVAKPGEADIPVPTPSETEAKASEAESVPSETGTNKVKPSETVTKPSDTTTLKTNPDQTKISTFSPTSSVTDRTTSMRPTQTTARPNHATRRPTVATKRPSLVGGSGGFPLPETRPGSLAGSESDRISGTDGTQQNKTTCRKPGVEYPIGITFDELRAALEEARVLLIDVRQPWELRETGRLPWSNNLPLPELEEAVKLSENSFMERYGFPKPMPEDNNVVLTCRSGRRVRQAWDLLEPYGYCNVKLYFGSYLDWKSRGGPLLPLPPARRP